MTTDFRTLCATIIATADEREGNGVKNYEAFLEALNVARAALAEPVPPVDGEVAELEANFRAWYQDTHGSAYFGAMPLCVAIGWAQHLLQPKATPPRPADGEVPEVPNSKEQALSVLDDVSDQLDAAHENVLRRALERLTPQPVPEGPSDDDADDLCAEFGFHYEDEESLALLQEMFRAVLSRWGQPVPEGPSDEELLEWATDSDDIPPEFLDVNSGRWERAFSSEEFCTAARAVLARWGHS